MHHIHSLTPYASHTTLITKIWHFSALCFTASAMCVSLQIVVKLTVWVLYSNCMYRTHTLSGIGLHSHFLIRKKSFVSELLIGRIFFYSLNHKVLYCEFSIAIYRSFFTHTSKEGWFPVNVFSLFTFWICQNEWKTFHADHFVLRKLIFYVYRVVCELQLSSSNPFSASIAFQPHPAHSLTSDAQFSHQVTAHRFALPESETRKESIP